MYYAERNELGYVTRIEYVIFFHRNVSNTNGNFKIVYAQLRAQSI